MSKNKIENKSKISFITLNKHVKDPEIIVNDFNEFVLFGEDNELPEQILDYYNTVGIHRSSIDKKAHMFIGTGISYDLTDERKAKKTQKFLNSVNPFETMDDLIIKVGLDMMLNRGVYFLLKWNSNKTSVELYHLDHDKFRSGKKDASGIIKEHYYNSSEDEANKWSLFSNVNEPYITKYPAYSLKSKNKTEILYIKGYTPGKNYYALPDYIGGLRDIDTLSAISDFNNSSIHNGLQPGLAVIYNGSPDPEEQYQIQSDWKAKYQDTTNANEPLFVFNEEEGDVKFEQIGTSTVSSLYKALEESTKENILAAHQIPRALSGLKTPGSLGNTKEYLDAVEIVRSGYIEPLQSMFLNQFNKIMRALKLNDISLTAPKPSLIQYDINIQEALTRDEIRDYLGYDPIIEEIQKEIIEEEVIEETGLVKQVTESNLNKFKKILNYGNK